MEGEVLKNENALTVRRAPLCLVREPCTKSDQVADWIFASRKAFERFRQNEKAIASKADWLRELLRVSCLFTFSLCLSIDNIKKTIITWKLHPLFEFIELNSFQKNNIDKTFCLILINFNLTEKKMKSIKIIIYDSWLQRWGHVNTLKLPLIIGDYLFNKEKIFWLNLDASREFHLTPLKLESKIKIK